jgi:hypothetical protein
MNSHETRLCVFSRTGESARFPIRHVEVRILPPQPGSGGSPGLTETSGRKPANGGASALCLSVSRLPIYPLADRERRSGHSLNNSGFSEAPAGDWRDLHWLAETVWSEVPTPDPVIEPGSSPKPVTEIFDAETGG